MALLLAALAAVLIASQLPPQPPDVANCHLSHSFVLGEAPDHPGAIEIWACEPQTVVTLTQFSGPWSERERRFRNSMRVDLPQDHRVVGCKDEHWHYAGVVGATAEVKRAQPFLERAWQADLEKWRFRETKPGDVICNRDFGLD